MAGRLSPLDLAVIIGYIVGTTLLGAWFTRRNKDIQAYFVGGRSVHWLLVLVSIVATETSTVTFLSVPGTAFERGDPVKGIPSGSLVFLQLSFGYVVGRCVIAWLLLPQYFGGQILTAYELLRRRFGPAVQRVASGLFLVTRTVADGLRLFLTALLLKQFTGWSIEASIVAMGAITVAYTYLGGMEAVIWTDLIQFAVYILGALIAFFLILGHLPGGWDEFVGNGIEHHKFTLFDFDPSRTKALTFWAGLIGGGVFTMASHGADQLMVQRYLCSRSVGEARRALISSGVVVLLQFLLFLLIGVGLHAMYQRGDLPLEPGVRNDAVFGRFIVTKMPSGLVGLIVAAVLAAAMSTLSSSLNSSSNAFVTDFYRPLCPNHSDAAYLRLSKLMTAFWGVAQILVAILAAVLDSPQSIVEQVLTVAGLTTGLVLGLFLLGRMTTPVSSTAALVGLGAGFIIVVGIWLPSTWKRPLLAWPWYAPVGAASTFAVAWGANLLKMGHGPSSDRRTQSGVGPPR